MRKILFIAFACIAGFAYSQDQLFKKDNTKIEAKILEINQTEIKYKLFNYQDGPTIIISKNDVAMIIYQNGTHEVFNSKTATPTENPNYVSQYKDYNAAVKKKLDDERIEKFNELTTTKNVVGLNFLEPMNGTFALNYLREFVNNLFNVYVPIGIGFAQPYFSQQFVPTYYSSGTSYSNNYISDFKFDRKSIEAGIGLHFQTSGKRAVTHFIGPYIGISQYNGRYNEYINTNTYGYYYSTAQKIEHGFVLNRYQILLDNGFLFRVTKNFNIILIGGVGYRIDDFIANNPNKFTGGTYNYNYNTLPLNAFKLGLSMGYRF